MWVAFASHIFSAKNISVYALFNDQSFNDTLTNDIVSFDQLGPEVFGQTDLSKYAIELSLCPGSTLYPIYRIVFTHTYQHVVKH